MPRQDIYCETYLVYPLVSDTGPSFGPRRDKTRLQGFRENDTLTSLPSSRD